MADSVLSPEPETEAQRWAALILQKAQPEVLPMARLLVSQADAPLLGATEFALRDRVHQLAAPALPTALNERNKGGLTARA